jgi:hypothetical protein
LKGLASKQQASPGWQPFWPELLSFQGLSRRLWALALLSLQQAQLSLEPLLHSLERVLWPWGQLRSSSG